MTKCPNGKYKAMQINTYSRQQDLKRHTPIKQNDKGYIQKQVKIRTVV